MTTVLDTLSDLIRINSINPNYPDGVAELAIAEYVESFFRSRSIPVQRAEVLPGRPNVYALWPGQHFGHRVVLEAHLDTVGVGGMTIPPFDPVHKNGRIYGRGSCDTKGGMAAMMHAVALVVESGIKPACEVMFAATIDEEFSYRGAAHFCNGLIADVAIIAEPTELAPVVASKGLVRWKIETHGKAAHSAKPHLGVNAIHQMSKVIHAIEGDNQRLAATTHPLLGAATCNVGIIHGGTQVNLVPASCHIELDRRLLPGETISQVLAHYQSLLNSLAQQDSTFAATMHPPMLTDVPLETNVDSNAVKTTIDVLQKLGHPAAPIGVPFCSDASKFGAIGIPSLILGPGSIDQAHAAVEYIDCQQVMDAVQIYYQILMQFQPSEIKTQ